MATMDSIERVETVLRGGVPDRVPVDLHDFMVAARRSGLPFPAYFQDGEAMAEGQIKAELDKMKGMKGWAEVNPRGFTIDAKVEMPAGAGPQMKQIVENMQQQMQ